METTKKLCAEAEAAFDPQKSMPENLVGVDFRHRAAVALWHFVQDMDEGGFALWFERGHGGHGKRTLGPFVAQMSCKARHRVIQMIKDAFERRGMLEFFVDPVSYSDLDAEWKTIREEFCEAIEKFLNKCPGCDAKRIDGPHRFSCHFAGSRQISIPMRQVGDKFVIDHTDPLTSAALEALKRQGD